MTLDLNLSIQTNKKTNPDATGGDPSVRAWDSIGSQGLRRPVFSTKVISVARRKYTNLATQNSVIGTGVFSESNIMYRTVKGKRATD